MPPRVNFDQQQTRSLKDAALLSTTDDKLNSCTTNSPAATKLQTTNNNEVKQQNRNNSTTSTKYHQQIVWRNVVLMSGLHIAALVGLRQCFAARFMTVAFGFILYIFGGLGITAGAHRLWSHRSYKAKWPLRLLLAAFNTLAFQNSIYDWSRDHRTHHKFSETDADPHNVNRGFFFAHVGWLLVRKHPDVINKGKQIDLADLEADSIVVFQHRHYLKLVLAISFIVPTLIPYLLWNETFFNSLYICVFLRYVITLNNTWLVNSAAHIWGRQPYDKSNHSTENKFVSLGALGEGFHNFHHTFPWHYAASELGYDINLTKLFIDTMALFGLAYERKIVSPDMIRHRKLRTGDVGEKGPYGLYN